MRTPLYTVRQFCVKTQFHLECKDQQHLNPFVRGNCCMWCQAVSTRHGTFQAITQEMQAFIQVLNCALRFFVCLFVCLFLMNLKMRRRIVLLFNFKLSFENFSQLFC